MSANILETESASTPRGDLQFAIMGGKSRRRVRRPLDKEPDTVAWIDCFEPQSVFWDVGSDTGMFSLYAALDPTIQIVAIEPGVVNFSLLVNSIELNGMEERISPFCIGFNERTQLSRLSATQSIPGTSFKVDIGEPFRRVDSSQATLRFSIDDLVSTFDVSPSTHLKIDVPNVPDQIGGATTIGRSTREILVEVGRRTFGPGELDACIRRLEHAGFALAKKFAKKDPLLADHLLVRSTAL